MTDQDKDQFFTSRLPGTGGDFIDSQDVEGHAIRRDEDQTIRRDDAETGLYNPGPTTQGEIIYRGPRDNPHGDR